ncbi:MAG: hypothetical protein COW89_02435 [Nitrospinae bacterium CG22_combo_CG10-13_8_21_14_all_47_10]|nr:MAG: hypothetical protein COW89_02435 [Nitrospinae bacterium CG22_combo_CG10-13_8_21_14_all_47_10]
MQGSGEHSGFLFILLGASNLARAYSAFTRHLAQNTLQCEFVNALGPGRAYCARGGLLNLTYPPIGECRVLESAKSYAKQGRRLAVLLTDIGNDIMYGVPDHSLIECLDTLIDKSLALNAEVFVTSIHVDISRDMGKMSFKLLKAIFYFKSPMTFEQASAAVKKVNQYLEEKSVQNERVHLVSGLGAFCGMDKIHYSLLKSHLAWSRVGNAMLSVLDVEPAGNIGPGSMTISLCKNLNRLIICDMLGIRKKPKGFF